jgi:hypothetical protein
MSTEKSLRRAKDHSNEPELFELPGTVAPGTAGPDQMITALGLPYTKVEAPCFVF